MTKIARMTLTIPRGTIMGKALIVANTFLEAELEKLRAARLATREGGCSTRQRYCRAIGRIGMIEPE